MGLVKDKPVPSPKALLEEHLARNPQAVIIVSEVNGQISYSVSNMPESQFFFFLAVIERHGRGVIEKIFQPKKKEEQK